MFGLFPNAAPWVDRTILKAWERLAPYAPSGARPILLPGEKAKFEDYGSGHYGSVMPTSIEGLVLKLTTDVAEANFVSLVVNDERFQFLHKKSSGIVHYYDIVKIKNVTFRRRPVFAIWREEAFNVGYAAKSYYAPIPRGRAEAKAEQEAIRRGELILEGWSSNLDRFRSLTHTVQMYLRPTKPGFEKRREKFLRALKEKRPLLPDFSEMKNPQKAALAFIYAERELFGNSLHKGTLRQVSNVMIELLRRFDILLADVHLFNIGMVRRDGRVIVAITDPGHMIILDPEKVVVPPIEEV